MNFKYKYYLRILFGDLQLIFSKNLLLRLYLHLSSFFSKVPFNIIFSCHAFQLKFIECTVTRFVHLCPARFHKLSSHLMRSRFLGFVKLSYSDL